MASHRILVAGSRSLENERQRVHEWLDYFVHPQVAVLPEVSSILENVSGTCHGPDKFGESWARKHGIDNRFMPADWYPNGRSKPMDRSAGHKRNASMALYLDQHRASGIPHGILFWDGISDGTDGMRKCLDRYKIRTILVQVMAGTYEVLNDYPSGTD